MGPHKPRTNPAAPLRLRRRLLFASTALSAVLAMPALAQTSIAPDTTPQGGVVTAGSAAITQAPGATTINQSSEKTAINWQSFDVGANATVQFNQPNSSAIALNRVVGGNLSQINGRINANGQIVLINQSGVVFAKGAQVNAESIVVSTSNISDKDFMAGHLNFTGAPNPGAKIINEGHITAGQAGLVGLVAPQVLNSGVITAKLGQVTLAGGTAFTLDLYGDRLISLDVTRAVRAVDLDGKTIPALVTNSGLIIADGGHITLTAQDADALVTQLINAGGTLRADSVGNQAGAITIDGIGGNIAIAGNLLARGNGAGSSGGAVQALTTGTVALASTASIDVSGQNGGGVVALGTDITRAKTGAADTAAPKATAVIVASGASINANATGQGKGGTVTLLSSQQTDFGGAIYVQGAPQGGDGGLAEISSDGVINLGGTVLATASNGRQGEILLDPKILIVTIGGTSGSVTGGGTVTFGGTDNGNTASLVDPSELNSLSGVVILEASKLVSVASAIDMTNSSALSLVSLGDVSITAGITVNGSLDLDASGSLFIGAELNAHNILLASGAAGTNIDNIVSVTSSGPGTGVLTLASGGTISEDSANGTIDAATLLSSGNIGGDLLLTGSNNSISNLGAFTSHNIKLDDATALTVTGSLSAADIDLSGTALSLNAPVKSTGTLTLDATGSLGAGTIGQSNAGSINAATLIANAGGNIDLVSSGNTIHKLDGVLANGGTLDLASNVSLAIVNTVTASDVTLAAPTLSLGADINVTQISGGILALGANNLTTSAGTFNISDGVNGTLDIAPFSAGTVIDLGHASSAGTLGLQQALLTALDSQASNITLGNGPAGIQASGIDIDANTSFGTGVLVDLSTSGAIMDNKATLTADTLEFGAADVSQNSTAAIDATSFSTDGTTFTGDVILAGTANSIAALGTFAAIGDLVLIDTGKLTINGPLTAADATLSAGSIAIAGSIGTPGQLALEATGKISETGGITAGTLSSGGTTIGGDVSLTSASNTIANLGNFTVASGHSLSLDDTGLLTIAGTVAAPSATLSAATIAISGLLNTPTALLLESTGNISETGGINTALLSTGGKTIGGDLALTGTNTIAALGTLDATGNIDVADTGALNVTGTAGAANITLTAGTLGIANTLSAPTGTIALNGGNITQTAGTLHAAALALTGDDVTLEGANSIATLGHVSLTNGSTLGLNVTNGITIAGPVIAPTASLTAPTITLAGNLTSTNALALGGSSITQASGTIATGTLSSLGSITGDVSLNSSGNAIQTLSSFILGGQLTLADNTALAITGAVTTPGEIDLSGTSVSESGAGAINAATLSTGAGSFTGAVSLTGNNSIATLGTFISGSSFTLQDAEALDLAGLLSAPGLITLDDTGGLTELTNGIIAAGTLAGSIAGAAALTNANTIANLDGFTLTGGHDLTLNNTGSLNIGDLSAADATISSGSLGLAGTLSVSNLLSLASATGIDQTAGVIDAPTLTGASTLGNVLLTQANTVATISGFTAAGDFDLHDSAPLTIASALTAANIGLLTPTLSVIANLDAIGTASVPGTLAIASDAILALGGQLLAPAGTIALAPYTNGNTIDLGGSVTGDLNILPSLVSILDATAADIILGSAEGRQAGAISISNSSSFANTLLDLTPTGTITDTGTLIADTLAVSGTGFSQTSGGALNLAELHSDNAITGAVSLTSTLNSIASLGSFTVTGAALAITDATPLTITGPASAQDITLADSNSLAVNGDLTAGSGGTINLIANSLTGTGSITAPAGTVAIAPYSVTAIDLGGTAANALDLSAGLISLVSAGLLQIGSAGGHSGGALSVDGPLSIGPATLALSGTSIRFNNSLTETGRLSLASPGNITESTGAVITAGIISGSGGTINLGGANQVGTLGGLASGSNLTFNNAAALQIAGLLSAPGSTILEAAGSITETTGSISTGTLGSGGTAIGGDASFGNANTIATLAGFTVAAGHSFDLTDTSPLTVAGSLVAPSATLSAGSIGISGSIDVPGLLALESTGDIYELSNGAVTAGTLTSGGATDGNLLLTNEVGDHIGTLGGINIAAPSGSLVIADADPLTVAGTINAPHFVSLNASSIIIAGLIQTGQLGLDGVSGVTETIGIIDAGTLSTTGGPLHLLNGNSISTINSMSSTGDVALQDTTGLTVAGNISTPGTLTLENSGAITQTGGSIIAAALTSNGTTIGGAAAFTQSGNTIASIGDFAASGGLALTDTGPLNLTGDISTGGNALNLSTNGAITQTAGIITTALLDASGADITLPDDNAITALGTVATGNLYAKGVAALTGPLTANNATIAALGNLSLAGPASISNALDLSSPGNITQSTSSGPVTAATATLTAGGGINLSGTMEIADQLKLSAVDNITHYAGVLDAGTLTGNAGALASFASITDFSTIGSFLMQDSFFGLTNAGPLTLAGPLRASTVSITAIGLLTLDGVAGGGLFINSPIAPANTTTPLPGDSVITVTQGPNDGPPQIVQTGSFYVNSGPDAAIYQGNATTPATLFLSTTPNGDITFAAAPPTSDGLVGPNTDLVLSAGPQGVITGNVNLFRVVILQANKVDLTGILDNIGGQQGAGKGVVNPFPQPNFRFNSCPIGSVNCTILPIESLPAADPLQNFEIEQRKKRKLNHNVQLPGIATRDF